MGNGNRTTHQLKKRTALFAKLREVFRRNVSQPLGRVIKEIKEINPILRGWVNYFRVGHASRCFSMVRHWVEEKVRRHLMRARGRQGKAGNGGVGIRCTAHSDYSIVTARVFLTLICQIESRMYGSDRDTAPERSVTADPMTPAYILISVSQL